MTDSPEERRELQRLYRSGEVSRVVTEDDLEWWLDIADDLEWKFAKTYAKHTPHWYLMRNRTRLSLRDYHRAHRVIVTFGHPEKFWRHTNMYLHDRPDMFKWWVMGPEEYDISLINRGSTADLYGTQDAPQIKTPWFSEYDSIATFYDELHPPEKDATALWRAFTELPLWGSTHPSVLDLGCGTGRAIAAKLPHSPAQYTGVDVSMAMMNHLLLKHWKYKDLHAMTARRFLRRDDREFDTVLILGDSAAALGADEVRDGIARARRQALVMVKPTDELTPSTLVDGYDQASVFTLSDDYTLIRVEKTR